MKGGCCWRSGVRESPRPCTAPLLRSPAVRCHVYLSVTEHGLNHGRCNLAERKRIWRWPCTYKCTTLKTQGMDGFTVFLHTEHLLHVRHHGTC